MKKIISGLFLTILTFTTIQTVSAQKDEWKELKTFHSIMSKTFHPSEEGNLTPLRENSSDLLAKAKAWQAAPIPAHIKQPEIKQTLVKLVAKCDEINNAVKAKKSDKDLKKLITEAHELFHQIAEKCEKPETAK